MDVAVRAEKRRCARLKRQCWCVLPEAVLLTVLRGVLAGLASVKAGSVVLLPARFLLTLLRR